MEIIPFTYNWPLVFLSVVVAVFSAFVALDISSRLAISREETKKKWIFNGAFVLGLGTWAMHFIAMLAFHSSLEVTYSGPIVILSVLPAFLSYWIAFNLVSQPSISRNRLLIGAIFIGTGITTTHYIGMEAMQMEAGIVYDPVLFVLSAVISCAASFASLYLLFHLRKHGGFHWHKIGSAVLMGFAVVGMHYTGMAAANFTHAEDHMPDGAALADGISLGYAVGIGTLLLLLLAYQNVRVDRRITAQSDASELKFQSVIESANDAIIVSDQDSRILQWNRGAERIFGHSKESMIGENLQLIIPERLRQLHAAGMARYAETKQTRVIGKTVELEGLRKDGTEFPIEMSLGTWKTETGVFFSSIIRDITERKQADEKISNLVYLDPLTGLPNRRLLNDRLESELGRAAERQQKFSLLYMDIDNFKLVNDMLGHLVGDQLLMEVTDRLLQHAGEKDTVARLGGDEFILLVPGTNYSKSVEYAQGVLDCFHKPFHFNGEELFITPSIGISLYPADGQDAETLIKNADLALYRVKEEGKNNFQFFTNEMDEEISRRSQITIGLRKGLDRGEFTIHYQPQIDIPSGSIIGVEALVRWHHPHMGTVSPGEFIPIAEESGTIIQLGEFVMRQACLQNKAWQDAGLPKFRVAINISARQFTQANLCDLVQSALTDSGLEAQYLELELTESIIQGSASAVKTMNELKAMGLHLSIDDFGTGYSSLSYLKLFPINTLKIDQYFTRNIHIDLKDAALVDTIISMAHNLGLNVIAEGVETKEQLHFLEERNCNQAQGYLFSRPLPADDIERIYSNPAVTGI